MNLSGSIKLFRLFGIEVSLHWSWILVALFQFQSRLHNYDSQWWKGLEYVTLFAIVLMHEFGHALACRSVGGQADRIVLWPLGGVAFVNPPPRPGALLWSIVAGPLVNVILVPFTLAPVLLARYGYLQVSPNAGEFLFHVMLMNAGLLIFNLLPVYPLDGGQILRALLWFIVGPIASLTAASIVGIVGIAALAVTLISLKLFSVWTVVILAFAGLQCYAGLRQAGMMKQFARLPRRMECRCPHCGANPPAADIWSCANCGVRYDALLHPTFCPQCGADHAEVPCPECNRSAPAAAWGASVVVPPGFPMRPGPGYPPGGIVFRPPAPHTIFIFDGNRPPNSPRG